MDSREQRRARLVPVLAKTTRSRDIRSTLGHAISDSNSLTLIPVLPDDPMSYLLDRLEEGGGRGVAAMENAAGAIFVVVMWPATAARVEVAREDDRIAHIHRDSHAEMFFEYLESVGDVVVQQVAAKLMDQGHPTPA